MNIFQISYRQLLIPVPGDRPEQHLQLADGCASDSYGGLLPIYRDSADPLSEAPFISP